MRDLFSKKRSAGMTLVEVMVTLAIIVIIALIMVSGFTTMANIDIKNTNRVNTDAGLSEEIAVSGVSEDLLSDSTYSKETATGPDALTLTHPALPSGSLDIPIIGKRYTDAAGSGFTIFDFDENA
jgi:prepilin-type N-terminal cleavage/methylation domain-containing protein